MNTDELLRKLLFLPEAATGFADSIDQLHFFVISVTMLGSLIVFATAGWFLIRFRRRGEPTTTPRVQATKRMEFTFIGVLLGLFILWWVIGFLQYIAYASPPPAAQEVYVVAKQWMWKFSYPDGRATVGLLVVPVDRDVRLVMTSRDVIHSFYVPAFRIKQDLLPGRYTTTWFRARSEGIFDVYCAEFCGTSHSRMWASVVALGSVDYESWLDGGKPPLVAEAGARAALAGWRVSRVGEGTTSMAEQGRRAASANGCLACHTIDGQPHIGPTWRNLFGKAVQLQSGQTVVADEEYLTRSMMEPLTDVVEGFPPVMPTYLGVLKQPDAAAIVEFIKSLRRDAPEPRVRLPDARVKPMDGEALEGAAQGSQPNATPAGAVDQGAP